MPISDLSAVANTEFPILLSADGSELAALGRHGHKYWGTQANDLFRAGAL
jgi:hypothetical protein